MRSDLSQIALIVLLALTAGLFGVFFMREVYPQYRVFQQTYEKLEEFRSTITGEPPAPFKIGVKQIVLLQDNNAPEIIDRCTSCHVALQLAHFSPTKIARDVNGNVMLDAEGVPIKVPNEEYVWKQLDDKIAELTDPEVIVQLEQEGKAREVAHRVDEAGRLTELKSTEIDGKIIDMTKVLAMHPLMGKETRPFEFHSIDDFGCTSCHSGNGRGLTMEKAHGPVFDGEYEEAFEGPRPEFLEVDPLNDPKFSKVFNHKPGHGLLFQTTPIYPGPLLQANCVQCHMTASSQLQGAVSTLQRLKGKSDAQFKTLQAAFTHDKQAVLSLFALERDIGQHGYLGTKDLLQKRTIDYTLPESERNAALGQLQFLQRYGEKGAAQEIDKQLMAALGSRELIQELQAQIGANPTDEVLDAFLAKNAGSNGSLFQKSVALSEQEKRSTQLDRADQSLTSNFEKNAVVASISSSVDDMTECYQKGAQLYVSQACYACHRISGVARGGVGPELTLEGNSYPWFIKESMVWPQADLRTSTMPNYKLDHSELEALTCYLLAQKGRPKYMSPVDYQVAIRAWEEGKKSSLEQPVEPSKIHDLRFGMTVFATEGCAACHRLKGFESNVGFAIEKKGTPTFDELYKVRTWFTALFPENVTGSELVQKIDAHAAEIDQKILEDVRQGAILEEIEQTLPGTVESFYGNFEFALRAKETAQWKERVRRVLKMYVQEYGLGRQIGPRPNWSGIYRSDEWLMEHFYNPASHVARSIMPVFPFDETKFYALTYMLDVLGKRNTEAVRQVWAHRGFNPEVAYEIHCAQCHGLSLQGDGPVAEWIYPIPKNLRNATFLRSLTKEKAKESIVHGVKGGPMAPWGELGAGKPFVNDTPVLTSEETDKLVDWLFQALPDENASSVTPLKWKYDPEDVLEELEQEGDKLESKAESEWDEIYSYLPTGEGLLASLEPIPTSAATSTKVDEIFDIRPYPVSGVDRQAYYIKDKYYTPQNITAGQALFVESCSICHGKEGAGTGLRSGAMVEAKPRMLTNLDWIATRDDLRLLQSIKYGVPGTSMTPWGDYTSTLQRLQLVMYIRSLSHEHILRDRLSDALYQAFDVAVETVRQAEIVQYTHLKELKSAYHAAEEEEDVLDRAVEDGKGEIKLAVEAYQKRVELASRLKKQKAIDDSFKQLITEVKDQRALYQNLCTTLLARVGDVGIVDQAIALIKSNAVHFELVDSKLEIAPQSVTAEKIASAGRTLALAFDTPIAALEREKRAVSGKINSGEQQERLQEIDRRIHSYKDAKTLLIASLEEAARSRRKQQTLVDHINAQIMDMDTMDLVDTVDIMDRKGLIKLSTQSTVSIVSTMSMSILKTTAPKKVHANV